MKPTLHKHIQPTGLMSLIGLIGLISFISLIGLCGGAKTAEASILRKEPNNLGLVGYWSFEDATGTTATDFSGQGNTGTLTGSGGANNLPQWTTGRIGTGLNFDGTDDYVSTPLQNVGYSAGTVSWWMSPNSTYNDGVEQGMWGHITSFNTLPSFDAQKYTDNNLYIGFDATSDDDRVVVAASATNFIKNVWQYYTFTWVSGGDSVLYRNGVEIGRKVGGTTPHDIAVNFEIGRQNLVGYFNGSMDDFRMYNRALSAPEITILYSQTALIHTKNADRALVGYWPMSEGGGSTTADDGVNFSNSGTLNPGAGGTNTTAAQMWTGSGKIGNAINFDGTDDYVDIPNTSSLAPSALSVAFWFKTNSVSTEQMIVGYMDESNNGYYAELLSSKLQFAVTTNVEINSTQNLSSNTWYHGVATYNGSNVKIYINGVNVTFGTGATSAGITNGTADFTIGKSTPFGGLFFGGIIDDARVYNRVLSATEVLALYNQTMGFARTKINSSRNNSLTSGRVGLWSFDGADVNPTTAIDRSGQGNNGTLTGASGSQNKPQPVRGRLGQALNFDGTDDYIDIPNSSVLKPTSFITITAWIQVTSAIGAFDRILDIEPDGSNGYTFFVGADGHSIGARIAGTLSNDYGVLSNNVWAHVAVVYDGSNMIFYVNGANVGSYPRTGSISYTGATTLYIGRKRAASSNYFDGSIDDVRIYNRALSAAEITQLYNMGK